MFRNFQWVFSFSFHNQITAKAYRVLTILLACALFILPVVTQLYAAHSAMKDEDEEIEGCGAERICVVSDMGEGAANLLLLVQDVEDNYARIHYQSFDHIDEAEASVKKDEAVFILYFHPEEEYVRADILIPEGSVTKASEAKHYFEFMKLHNAEFSMLLSGISGAKLYGLTPENAYKTYTQSGYEAGITIDEDEAGADELLRSQIKSVLRIAMPYLTIMLLYFMILTYGNSIAQAMVMEKESKLMDTMLISLKPEALVFGKLLAAIAAALLQLFIWIISALAGLALGLLLTRLVYADYESPLLSAFGFFGELKLFAPVHVILGILFLIFGFVMYASLAAIAGAISSSREEVGSQSFLFVLPLLISFMLLMMGGGLENDGAPAWMLYLPFTSALIMPAELSLGLAELIPAFVSFILLLAFTLCFVIAAGRLYKMMSLYKGNKVSLGQAVKMLFDGT